MNLSEVKIITKNAAGRGHHRFNQRIAAMPLNAGDCVSLIHAVSFHRGNQSSATEVPVFSLNISLIPGDFRSYYSNQ